MKRHAFILLAFLTVFNTSFGQSLLQESKISDIERDYQVCLDKGVYMVNCSKTYYKRLDSCLNSVYKQLNEKLDSPASIREEQLLWMNKRDTKFGEIDRSIKEEGFDGEMLRLDEKAKFLKQRVIILAKRLKH